MENYESPKLKIVLFETQEIMENLSGPEPTVGIGEDGWISKWY